MMVYQERLKDVRERHSLIWRARLLFIALLGALLAFRTNMKNVDVHGADFALTMGLFFLAMVFIDVRYQVVFRGLEKKLTDLERELQILDVGGFRAGTRRFLDVVVIYVLLGLALGRLCFA